jgi:glutamate racemase
MDGLAMDALAAGPRSDSDRREERAAFEGDEAARTRAARALVFDSGLGGVTVLREIRALRSDLDILYAADDAAFPYGAWPEAALVARVDAVMERLIGAFSPDVVVIACNTASTLVLGPLRARWPELSFVGTVPAVKPAAAATRSGLISVLATPGTVARDYTRKLIDDFAARCAVTLVGATRLAGLAEAAMRGETVEDAAIAAEIAPCFIEKDGRRTDAIALACTHYPLLIDAYRRLAPWPVAWIDPAPAIARRVDSLLRERGAPRGTMPGRAVYAFTSGRAAEPALAGWLARLGLAAAPAARHSLPVAGR